MPRIEEEDSGKVARRVGCHRQWNKRNVQKLYSIIEDEDEGNPIGDLEKPSCDGRCQGFSTETWKGYRNRPLVWPLQKGPSY